MALRRNQTLVSAVLAAAVANNGTYVVPAYPAGKVQADFQGGNALGQSVVILNDSDRYLETAAQISVTYGASTITITNLTGQAWPAGSKLSIGLSSADSVDSFAGQRSAPVTNPTGGATVDAESRAAIVAINAALVKAGITR